MLTYLRWIALGLTGLFLSACESATDDAEVVQELARTALVDIQPKSTREGREYCGLVIRRSSGELYATKPIAGQEATCPILLPIFYPEFEPGDVMAATYHTHSAASTFGGPEWPSLQDLEATQRLKVPGYIITPGGRFWFIEKSGDVAYQLCGLGCLTPDQDFKASLGNLAVPDQVTVDELRARQR